MNNNFNMIQLTEEIENIEENVEETTEETSETEGSGEDQKGDVEINLLDAN